MTMVLSAHTRRAQPAWHASILGREHWLRSNACFRRQGHKRTRAEHTRRAERASNLNIQLSAREAVTGGLTCVRPPGVLRAPRLETFERGKASFGRENQSPKKHAFQWYHFRDYLTRLSSERAIP